MAQGIKKATRDSYGEALVELSEKYSDLVVLDADLAKATKTEIFKKKCPDHFIDCGIAEGNMIGVAAGLAAAGKRVFASSFAMFAAGRAFEQVRNSIGYPKLPVTIAATHAGISVGEDGATHQCCEDIGLMRTIPGMTILNPCDDIETKCAVKAAAEHQGPVYIRLGRVAVEAINNPEQYHFELGKGIVLKEGSDITIIATGLMVQRAYKAACLLSEYGVDAEVINIHTVKPLDEELICRSAGKTKAVLTCEEHNIIGGLSEAVASCLARKMPVKMDMIGIEDRFGMSGNAEQLLSYYGLTAENISEKAKKLLGK